MGKTSQAESPAEKKFLDEERSILAEERTLLAYVRTILALVGIAFAIARLFFDVPTLTNPIMLILISISVVILLEEFLRIRNLKKHRLELSGIKG